MWGRGWSRRLTDVWVPEDESLVQLVLYPVHLAADYAEQCLAVYEDLDTVLFDRLVKGARLVDEFQMICQPRAASVLNANTDKLRIRLVE